MLSYKIQYADGSVREYGDFTTFSPAGHVLAITIFDGETDLYTVELE